MICDVPGIGSPGLPNIEVYCRKIDLYKYDIFLVFSKGRFTNNDKLLVEHILKVCKKPFYFVRTNIDNNIKNNFLDYNKKEDETKAKIKMIVRKIWQV